MRLLAAIWIVGVCAIVAACALMPDYHEVTVSYGEGDLDPDSDARADFDSSATIIAYTMGWAPGDRARHRDLIHEQERNFKRMVAAQDRAQLAFLTGKAQEESTDILGNPVDVLSGYITPPKNMNEALVGLIGALSLAIIGTTIYLLRKQHRKRNGREKSADA